MCQAEIFVQ